MVLAVVPSADEESAESAKSAERAAERAAERVEVLDARTEAFQAFLPR